MSGSKAVANTPTTRDGSASGSKRKSDQDLGEQKIYLCAQCGKMFKSISGLSLHLKNKHSCQICNKGFNHSVQYRYHCASHLKVSLDKCTFCKAEFTSHGSLKRYLQLCYNIKPNTFVSDDAK